MSEIVVEAPVTETIIELGDGTVVDSSVSEEVQTVVTVADDAVVIDLNSGSRGEPGSAVIPGDGYPTLMDGTIGDVWITVTGYGEPGDVYLKTSAGWVLKGNVRGPAGGIDTVNGYPGPVVNLDKDDVGLDQVDNTNDLNKPISTATQAALDTTVKLSGAQTIAGTKTFSNAPVVPANAFAITRISGLQSALDALQSSINTKEPTILAGNANQYWRGDKTWQILDKSTIGLSNVTNDAQVTVDGAPQAITGTKVFQSVIIVPEPTVSNHAATKNYVDTSIGNLVNSAPGLLDTLDELAAALGDDPNFATTVSNNIATKEPIINPGTTAQYWRGDKTWQTLDKSAVGLGLINNVAQVEIAGSQTITGAKTFSALLTASAGLSTAAIAATGTITATGGAFELGRTDGTASTPFIDFHAGATATDYDVRLIAVSGAGTAGTGALEIKASTSTFSGSVTATGFTGSGAGLTALNGTNISQGTVADARLSTNQATLSGTQTFSGAKTFTLAATFSAAPSVPDASWTIAKTSGLQTALDAKQPLLGMNTLVGGADWNTYTTTGVWPVNSVAGANAPASPYQYGVLTVNASGGTMMTQMYVPHQVSNGAAAYIRVKYNASDWSTWRPLFDGTMTVLRVVHNGSSWPARPVGATYVEWVGPVAPTTATANDTWVNTSV